ncbi:MAG TPA: outer membrane lipoprotein-sorting protein [Bacteroidia bacterium]|jgi:hypothetical protein|nr:outer membrane lipoprotein-sorting protein [Bacteroidia bacterium]
MKILRSTFTALLLFAASTAFCQTADEIVQKHVKAIGGADKINAVKTVKMTGKLSSQGMELPMTMYVKLPHSMRTEITVQGLSIVSAVDSKTLSGWYTNPMSGDKSAQKMNQEQAVAMQDQCDDVLGPLTNYKEKGGTIELIGKDDVEGTEVYKLMLTKKNKDVAYYYLDASTYLVVKETSKVKFQDKEIESESYYSNYKTIDGITFATTQEEKEGGQLQSQIKIEKIEVNVPVDESLFAMPVKAEEKTDPKKESK